VYILENAALPATERAIAGQSLAVLGDPRPGVGLRADGLPDIAWCEIPAGSFLMGDDKQEALPAYKISRYPVTNAQFWAFVEDQGYQEAGYWAEAIEKGEWSEGQYKGCYDPEARIEPVGFGLPFNLANHPVVGITWYEAMAFCRWLSARLGEQVTLPSESQWEKAARGTDGRIYPWGDEADPNRANYDDTRLGSTSAVGCFPNGESPYHCLDMSGNVWEWCADWYDEKKKTRRVVRGGSWHSDGSGVRCALRRSNLPDDHGIGFRVVVSRGPG
jgi:formylglycine-generating enzyme required for sulfatase activity